MRKIKQLVSKCTALLLAGVMCLSAGITASAAPEAGETKEYTNVAYRKEVTATSVHPENTYFSTAYLTDGINVDLSQNSHVGWSTAVGLGENSEVELILDLAGNYVINEVAVCPMAWESGKFFPASYEVSISQDKENWTKVGEAVDLKTEEVGAIPQRYSFVDAKASYVKIHITKNRVNPDDGTIYSQIGEIEVSGYEAGPEYQNVSLGKPVIATSSNPDATYFSTEYLTDGINVDLSENLHVGWSTSEGLSENSEVELVLDLQDVYFINEVAVCPMAWESGKFFPASFEVLISMNNMEWTKVGEAVDLKTEEVGATPQRYSFGETSARYVKIHITKNRVNPDDGTIFSQIGEIEVNGYQVGTGEASINKTALRMNPGATDKLRATIDADGVKPNVVWSSDDERIATIDENGTVTAVSFGETILRGHDSVTNSDFTCEILVDDYVATEHFMISAFWPMLKTNINDEYMDLMAEAGITNVQLNYVLDVANYEDNMKIAQMAYERGMGITASEKKWGWGNWANYSYDEIYEDALKYSHVPGVIGYYLIDEPADVTPFLDVFAPIKAAMPTADVHFNFTYAMNGAEKLIKAVGSDLDYLMYDSYIWLNDWLAEADLFRYSDKCRELGLKYDIKTAKYIQSCGFNNTFRKPNGNEIRYDVSTALAYGYKQINYFCWRKPEGVGETFTSAIVTEDGQKTEIYDDVAAINKTALALGDTLMKVDAIGVYHTGRESGANVPLPKDFFVQPTETKDLIISYMRDKTDNTNYSMLVNRDYENSSSVSFKVDDAISSIQRIDNITGEAVAMTAENGVYTHTFEPGGCLLIKVDGDYDYTPDYGKFFETPAGENAAKNDSVEFSFSVGENGDALIDGSRLLDGWKGTEIGAGATIEFGGLQTLNRVDLYPGDVAAFPKDFVIEVTSDGQTWMPVVEQSGYVLGDGEAASFTFDEVKVQAVRLRITGLNDGKFQINELELYNDDGTVPAAKGADTTHGVVSALRPADNLARGKEIIHSSSYEHGPYWQAKLINDGVGYDAIPSGNAGWASGNRFKNAQNDEWIGYNLGEKKLLNKVVVYNAFAGPAECFPTDYTVDVSNDGQSWTTVYTVENDANFEQVGARVLEFEPVKAQYVRFRGTRLTRNGEGFMMQLSEVEVYGTEMVDIVDKSALQAQYDANKEKQQGSYTDASWQAFQTALAQAKAVLDQTDATQRQVDAAVYTLALAVNGLEKTADMELLRLAIALGDAEDTAGCTPSSVKALTDALEAGRALLGEAQATQEQVNDAVKSILNALINLADQANKARLTELADTVGQLTESKYTEQTWQALQEALAEANRVLADGDAKQPEVDDAYKALLDAMLGLQLKGDVAVNKGNLKLAIDLAKPIVDDAERYVSATIEGLAQLLNSAQALYDNPDATQSAVDQMAQELLTAASKARLKANKTGLEAAVTQANAIDLQRYTEPTAEVFSRALAQANLLLQNEALSEDDQKLVDDAQKALVTAMQKLVAKGDSPTNTPSTPSTGDGGLNGPFMAALLGMGMFLACLLLFRQKKRDR